MLKWTFGADTGPFKRGLDSMRQQTKGLAGSLKGQLAGALGIGAIVAGMKQLFTEMDRVQKLGLRFGESAETIQKVGLAASLAGSSLEAVAKSIAFATKGAMDASTGTKTMADNFERLGIDAEKFLNLSMEDKMLMLAGSLESGGTASENLSNMMSVIGKQGGELIPLLSQGQEELRKQFKETETVSQKTVDAIARFNDQVVQMTHTIKVAAGNAMGAWQSALAGLDIYVSHLSAFIAAGGDKELIAQAKERMGIERQRLALGITQENAAKIRLTNQEREIEATKEQIKEQEKLMKLQEKLANAQKPFESKEDQISAIDEELKEARAGNFGLEKGSEEQIKAETRWYELTKERADLVKAIAAEKEASQDKEVKKLDEIKSIQAEIAEIEAEMALDKLTTAQQILALEAKKATIMSKVTGSDKESLEAKKEALGIESRLIALKESQSEEIKTKTEELADLDKEGGTLITSSLAAVGGGGPVAMFGEGQIEQKKVDLLQDIRDLLAADPNGPNTPQEPTA